MLIGKDYLRLRTDIINEVPKEIYRSDFIDWFLKKQERKHGYCTSASVSEIIKVAEQCHVKIIR